MDANNLPKIKMGGGVPGTPAFPYFDGTSVAWSEQSDWGIYAVMAWSRFSDAEKKAAAEEWIRRYPVLDPRNSPRGWAGIAATRSRDILHLWPATSSREEREAGRQAQP